MMEYEISLSCNEVKDLAWLVDRGYWPAEAYDAMDLRGDMNDAVESHDMQQIWVIPEHAAWSIIDAAQHEGYLACCGGPMLEKLVDLEGRIV